MEQPTNQFDSTPKNNSVFLPIIMSVLLTAVITGGGIYWWANQKQTELNNELNSEIVSLRTQVDQLKQVSLTLPTDSSNQTDSNNAFNDEIVFLRTQIEQLKQASVTPPTDSNNQSDELFEAKFRLAMRNYWDVREIFRNPQDRNKFYYITGFDDGASIWVYDLAQDTNHQQDGYIDPSKVNTLLLNQKLAPYQEFRGVGFSGNKFVFVETSSEDSPGPCFSRWLYSRLEYIDLGISKPTRKPFTLPDDLKKAEEQQATECRDAI